MREAALGRSPSSSAHKHMKGSLASAFVRPGQCQPFGAVPAVLSQARYLTFLNHICKSGLIICAPQIIVGITWNLTICVNTWHYLAWRRCSGSTSLVRKGNVATAQECWKMLFETQILFSNLFSCWFPINNRDKLITEYRGPKQNWGVRTRLATRLFCFFVLLWLCQNQVLWDRWDSACISNKSNMQLLCLVEPKI